MGEVRRYSGEDSEAASISLSGGMTTECCSLLKEISLFGLGVSTWTRATGSPVGDVDFVVTVSLADLWREVGLRAD